MSSVDGWVLLAAALTDVVWLSCWTERKPAVTIQIQTLSSQSGGRQQLQRRQEWT